MTEEYVTVDLEMTGLKTTRDRILEIGAVKIRDGQLTDTFHTFVNPHRTLSPVIVNLTGITDEMVADAPEIDTALVDFLEFAQELPLIGHGLMYDYSFLKQNAVNLNLTFERSGIDTLKIARKMLPADQKKSLASLCELYQISRRKAHRALDDAVETAELFLILRDRYGAQNPEIFQPRPLRYKVKKQSPITPVQKKDLYRLMTYHKITADVEIEHLTRSEASRMIDRINAEYGKVPKV